MDILNEDIWVSSHGYRQDEFLALIRLAEEFGFVGGFTLLVLYSLIILFCVVSALVNLGYQRPLAVLQERARASSARSLFWIAYLSV